MNDSLLIPFEDVEFWKPVVGYEGLYEVSNLGRVKSLSYNHSGKEKNLKTWNDRLGYCRVQLNKDGKRKSCLIHRLVYEAFIGMIPKSKEIDHIDRIRDNNSVSNLRVVSHKENMNNPNTRKVHVDATRKMLKKRHEEDPEFTKMLTEASVKACSKPVLQLDMNTGEMIKKWDSAAEAHRQTGVNFSHISACCRGKRKTAGGSRWVFG